MKITKYSLILLLLVLPFAGMAQTSDGVIPGILRVRFKTTNSFDVDQLKIKKLKSGVIRTKLSSIDKLNEQFRVYDFKRVFPYNAKYEERHKKHGLHLWYEIRYNPKENYKKVVKAFENVDVIEIAEPLRVKKVIPYEIKPFENKLKSTTAAFFNDPYLSNQWHYQNTGQTGGTPGADANIVEAWKVTTGNPNVIVSIHDQGVDVKHEDLKDNIWVNEAELNGVEGVDDDGNGYVDDIHGFNFVNYTGEIEPMEHGTHVAGTIGAINNNGLGVCGVAGGSGNNDGVRIMSCQILGDGSANIAASYIYAADNGSVISQNSWGYSIPDVYEQSVLDAIDYFIEEAGKYSGSPMKGGIVIFAAGNSSQDGKFYPGYYKSVLAVTATGPTNKLAYYSNYGTWTEIAAPGGDYHIGGNKDGVLSSLPGNSYGYMQGTSMACPHVSGIAALAVAKWGGSNFTNKDLENRILTGYKNIDDLNPDYVGLMGEGLIDGAKVVAENKNIAPDKITDLVISSISQDFMNIEWSVPADQDDGQPLYFDIYYDDQEINEDNYTEALKITIKNDSVAGIKRNYRIENLLPLTQYYVAIVSVDRWSNNSELSNVVSDTTNNGPDIDIPVSNITISADQTTDYKAEDSIFIKNLDKGVLKWKVDSRHVKAKYPYNVDKTKSSIIDLPYPGKVGKEPAGEEFSSSGAPSAIPSTLYWQYYTGYDAMVIGEEDTTLSNSSAIKFTLPENISLEGFNLTDVKMMLRFTNVNGPAIMEIYGGDDITTAELLLSQEVSSTTTNIKEYSIKLIEELYFKRGESFWIVFHVPKGNLYPLGIAREGFEEASDNSLMSFDMGKHWQKLENAIKDPRWVWKTVAISRYNYLGKYISLTPESGEINYNDSSAVKIDVDGAELPNGTYTSNIVISSNDTDEPQVRVPLKFNVAGHQPKMVYNNIIDFGSVLHGRSKVVKDTIFNTGLGNFQGPFKSITLTGDGFSTSRISKYSSIKALGYLSITYAFEPPSVGTFNGKLTIVDANDKKVEIYLNGVGAEPPVASTSPDSTIFDNVTLGDTLTGSFSVKNTGKYPMRYFMPAYSDGSNIGDLSPYMHKFGYTSEYTINDPSGQDPNLPFVWNDISGSGIPVQDHLQSLNADYYPVNIGFEMPFYGESYDTIYITDRGVLTFDDNSTFNSTAINHPTNPHGYISGYWGRLDMHIQGEVYYKREPGKFIVQYSNVGYLQGSRFYYISFQIIIFANGNIEYYYKDGNFSSYKWKYIRVNIENADNDDAYMVNNGRKPTASAPYNRNINLTKYSAIRIISPGRKLLSDVTNAYGTIPAGDSTVVDFKLLTDSLFEGALKQNVSIVSNDPFNNPVVHTVIANITSGGQSKLSISNDTIDMGQIFQNGQKSVEIFVRNNGTKSDSVTTVQMAYGTAFSCSDTAEVELLAKTNLYLDIEAITKTIGNFEDDLIIGNSGGVLFKVHLISEVIEAPDVSLDVANFEDTLKVGEMSKHALTVANTGGNDLTFTTNGNNWWYLWEDSTQAVSGYDDMTYTYITSRDEGGPQYRWIDIVESGVKFDHIDRINNPWRKVKLPFTYNFYGIDYDTIYIADNGVVTFTEGQGSTFFPGQGSIPDTAHIDNFIAPLFAFGGTTDYFDERGGVYFRRDNDKFIVTWIELMDNFGMGNPMNVELILYPDGNMKFQYSTYHTQFYQRLDMYGLIGVENLDGSEGVVVSGYQKILQDKMAISMSTAKQYVVAPGEDKKFNLVTDARNALTGNYSDSLTLFTNDPLKGVVKASVKLTITGSNTATAIDSLPFTSIDMDTIMSYKVKDELGNPAFKQYIKQFKILNTGDSVISLTSGSITVGKETEFQVALPGYYGTINWKDIKYLRNHPDIYPGETSWDFRVIFTPKGDTLPDGSLDMPLIEDTLNLIMTNSAGSLRIPVKAAVSLPPSLSSNGDTLSVLADTNDHVETKSFEFNNNNGLSALNYTLKLKYLRDGDLTYDDVFLEPSSAGSDPLKQSEITYSGSIKSGKVEGYDNTLEYDNQESPSTTLGYGGSRQFATVTQFTSPDNGFVLSDVMTWYAPGELLNSLIKYEVRAGSNMDVVLGGGTYTYTIPSPDPRGHFMTIHLEDSIRLKPSENFWIIITYPIQARYPQGIAQVNEVVKGRFLFGTGDGTWYDIINTDFSGYGWMIKALEKTHYDTGWARILSPKSGSLPMGSSVSVDVEFVADQATEADNYAEVIISTNDPENKEDNILLYMHVNQAPEFTELPEEPLSVNENETLSFTFKVTDIEHDELSCSISGSTDAELTFEDGNGEVVYNPDYEASGAHVIILTASDDKGHETEVQIPVTVNDVNRPPIPQELDDIMIGITTDVYTVDVSNAFIDEDGDDIDLLSAVSMNNSIKVSLSGSDVIIIPQEKGVSTITVYGTDNRSDKVANTFDVSVVGLESSFKANKVFSPNGDGYNDTWTIEHADLYGNADIRIYDENGLEVFSSLGYETPWDGTDNGKQLKTGTYYYIITLSDGTVLNGTIALIK